jgi:hypothetical protein
MCHSFRSIDTLKWVQCENSGTSSCLRTLKSDNQEYTTDERAEYLYRQCIEQLLYILSKF